MCSVVERREEDVVERSEERGERREEKGEEKEMPGRRSGRAMEIPELYARRDTSSWFLLYPECNLDPDGLYAYHGQRTGKVERSGKNARK